MFSVHIHQNQIVFENRFEKLQPPGVLQNLLAQRRTKGGDQK